MTRLAHVLLLIFCFCSELFGQPADVFEIARTGSAIQMQEILDQHPQALNAATPQGFTPLILSCYRGNNDVAKFLIANGVNLNSTSSMGTALMATVVKGNVEIAKLLLANKANPDLTDANGTTALMYAVKFQNPELVKLLIDHKADKALLDKDSKTAFEYAVFSGNPEIITLLK